jgi:hypothetical protein
MQAGISFVGFVVGYSTFTEVVCCCAKRNLDTFMLFNFKILCYGKKTAPEFLANLEYEFRVFGYSVWVCITECQCEPYF